jgi:hypothetical protein
MVMEATLSALAELSERLRALGGSEAVGVPVTLALLQLADTADEPPKAVLALLNLAHFTSDIVERSSLRRVAADKAVASGVSGALRARASHCSALARMDQHGIVGCQHKEHLDRIEHELLEAQKYYKTHGLSASEGAVAIDLFAFYLDTDALGKAEEYLSLARRHVVRDTLDEVFLIASEAKLHERRGTVAQEVAALRNAQSLAARLGHMRLAKSLRTKLGSMEQDT